ncbi:helix-turn-helix domain-containing protein [Microbispora sp. NEAU-D428]|uniref:LuxR C-terminal-related transcriptional regulator n=1 Tax=Microbispora sitophila TaxID=2771537 RepID=UPI001867F457|nr:helix-turn-helix transcriptional regulator [Microbispora sitophila]MBE3014808.1 helix-turn-helix domain-containing protein [Microbispora sitophila]
MGRETEVQALACAVSRREHSVVFLVGDIGVGKTRLADEAVTRVGPEAGTVLRLSATPAAASLPLGAFAPLLPYLDVPDAMLLPSARDALLAGHAGGRLVLLVDDAHNLDSASAVLTHQLTLTGKVVALVIARSGDRLPDALTPLWKDERALRLRLEPLPEEDMEDLIAQALPGRTGATVLRELRQLSAGSPLILRELISYAAGTGSLRLDGDRGWVLERPLTVPPYLLDMVVGERVKGLSRQANLALRLVALSEPLGYRLLCEMAGEEALRDLEDRRLVEVRRHELRREVRLTHPLLGEAVLGVSTFERRRLLVTLADAVVRTGMRRHADLARVADWWLQAGEVVDPDMLARAAAISVNARDSSSAVRLAWAAKAMDGGVRARLLLGHALAGQGRAEEAESVLATAMTRADLPHDLAAIGIVRSENLLSGLEAGERAAQVAAETAAGVAGSDWADEVTAHEARLRLLRGESEAAFALTAPLLRSRDPRTFTLAALTEATALTWDARPESCLELMERAVPLYARAIDGGLVQWAPHMDDVVRVVSLSFVGRLSEAEALAVRVWRECHRRYLVVGMALAALCRGHIALSRGRPRTARRWLRRSAELYGAALPSRRRWPLALLLEAEVYSGSRAAARDVAAELKTAASGPVRNLAGMERIALAWLVAAEGRIPHAESQLLAVAETSGASGARTVAVEALHTLARLGRGAVALPLMRNLRPAVEGPFMTAKLDMIEAAAHHDPTALSEAGAAFDAMGAALLAAEAWAESSRCYARRGERRSATRMREQAWSALRSCEQARTPMVTFTQTTSRTMTDREREVALLAAEGLPSKQIAERLHLSRRTVDNYLQQCYRKLGINRREQIKALMAGAVG